MNFSVIVPVAHGDNNWKELLFDLTFLDKKDECLFVSSQNFSQELKALVADLKIKCVVKWISSDSGRALQLNTGAQNAKNPFLWFVHCDSRIPKQAFVKLKECLQSNPENIYFFNLKFQNDGPLLIKLNEIGARFRSNALRLPFGDQAFCLSKNIFHELNGFNEKVDSGEDHLFIWNAHQKKIGLEATHECIYTSARKYKSEGWSQTTKRHITLTFKQAIPQLTILLRALLQGPGK